MFLRWRLKDLIHINSQHTCIHFANTTLYIAAVAKYVTTNSALTTLIGYWYCKFVLEAHCYKKQSPVSVNSLELSFLYIIIALVSCTVIILL